MTHRNHLTPPAEIGHHDMNTYRIDVRIYATAYIQANSESEALDLARSMANTEPGDYEDEGPITLSPAMTVWGVDDDSGAELVDDEVAQLELEDLGLEYCATSRTGSN